MGLEINISREELQKRSVFLAVPMYGGMCHGSFAKSIASLHLLLQQQGIRLEVYFLFNESLIQRGRNYCVDAFLRSGCSHLMFVDADIGFNAEDVLTMLCMAGDDSEYNILCGPYAKKCISWEKIKYAVDKGFADENPNALEQFVGDYVFNPASGSGSYPLDEPFEILEGGTGFMMIQRKVFEKFAEAHPEQSYKPDHVRSQDFDGSREIVAYFDCKIDPESKRYLSEDYYFCQESRKLGLKVWLCPWMKLSHTGTYTFGGEGLHGMAALGVAPTADNNMIKKKSGQV
jgi:hypothetical protein